MQWSEEELIVKGYKIKHINFIYHRRNLYLLQFQTPRFIRSSLAYFYLELVIEIRGSEC
jgi:hypothetical protein